MQEDAEGRLVVLVVPLEVVLQEGHRAFDAGRYCAAVGHGAGEAVGAVPADERHLPQPRVGLGGAGGQGAGSGVGRVVEGEGPDGRVAVAIQITRHHGRVVFEAVVLQHLVLVVPAHLQERHPHPLDGIVRDLALLRQLLPHALDLVDVAVVAGVGPEGGGRAVGETVRGDLLPALVQLLHEVVLRRVAGHEERAFDRAAVGVAELAVEQLRVVVKVGNVDAVVESEHDHHGRVLHGDAAGDVGADTAAVWQLAGVRGALACNTQHSAVES